MIKVIVPATTANLGPGFDVLGMALSQYSEFEAEAADEIEVVVSGLESDKIEFENNLVLRAMNRLFEYVDRYPKGYRLYIKNNIALARGMGSSASAIVGGLMIANRLVDAGLGDDEILNLATELEGHPDNVAPAIFGNLILSTKIGDEVIYKEIEPFEDLRCVLFVPDYEVSTKDSRGVLPDSLTMEDAVHTSSRLALLVYGFMIEDRELIGKSMDDRLHEPYRKKLIKGFDDFKEKALECGAFAFSLSGSGSTVIAYGDKESAQKILEGFEELADRLGISGKAVILKPCVEGAKYLEE